MPADPAADADGETLARTGERLERIEFVVAHLERQVELISQSLIQLQQDVRGITAAVERQAGRLQRLEEPPEIRDPAAEQPPHY